MRRFALGSVILCGVVGLNCGPAGGGPPCSDTDAGSVDFQCAGVTAVSLTKLQTDILTPTCALSSCHAPGGLSPTDYSTLAKSAHNVGLPSTYGGSLKVVAANDLLNSTMWIKALGGSPRYKSPSPACGSVGGIMPQGAVNPMPAAQLNEIKGWICSGAPAQ